MGVTGAELETSWVYRQIKEKP